LFLPYSGWLHMQLQSLKLIQKLTDTDMEVDTEDIEAMEDMEDIELVTEDSIVERGKL
jgi:hypothetical protein